jgi:hypothetical protein
MVRIILITFPRNFGKGRGDHCRGHSYRLAHWGNSSQPELVPRALMPPPAPCIGATRGDPEHPERQSFLGW